MKLRLTRFSHGKDSTLGLLHLEHDDGEKEFLCYTLEDEFRTKKVWGETRIPEGKYKIGLREFGGFYNRYTNRWDWHKGMLQLLDVPNFRHILIHIGNDDDDTAGCILLGDSQRSNVNGSGFIGYSTISYKRFYKKILNVVRRNELYIYIDSF